MFCFFLICPCFHFFQSWSRNSDQQTRCTKLLWNVDGNGENLIAYHITDNLSWEIWFWWSHVFHFSVEAVGCSEQVSRLNMISNNFSCRYPIACVSRRSSPSFKIIFSEKYTHFAFRTLSIRLPRLLPSLSLFLSRTTSWSVLLQVAANVVAYLALGIYCHFVLLF